MTGWHDMDWQARADTGRSLGGQHLPRPRQFRNEVAMDGERGNVVLCENCGSPDVREVERTARSSETTAPESVSWRCIDCGHEQGAA